MRIVQTRRSGHLYVHPGLRRVLAGRWGWAVRLGMAAVLALASMTVVTLLGFEAAYRLPYAGRLVCPPGHQLSYAYPAEIFPDPRAGRRRGRWLGCRNTAGYVLPDPQPHYRVMQTLALGSFLLLLPVGWRLVRRILTDPVTGKEV